MPNPTPHQSCSTRMGGWRSVTTSYGGPQDSTKWTRVKDKGHEWRWWGSSLSTAGDAPKHTHHSQVLHFWDWEGAYHGNGNDNVGTKLISKRRTAWSPVGSRLRPSASPCILMVPQYPSNEQTWELEPNMLPGGSILYMGEEGSPTPPTQKLFRF